MAKTLLTRDILESLLLGASVLGGGQASMKEGRDLGDLALRMGSPYLLDIDDVDPHGTIVTCATITCPKDHGAVPSPRARVRSLELLLDGGVDHVAGVITSECAAHAVINGWIESAMLGLPIVDAPCDGRGHPLAEMGSMKLHLQEGYLSAQSFAGEEPESGEYIEGVMRGAISTVSSMIRQNAFSMGGWLAVARNPVSAEHVRDNGAPGAIRRTILLGEAMRGATDKGAEAVIETVEEQLLARRVYQGPVQTVDRFTAGGMHSGTAFFGEYELSFWKEYMTLEKEGRRIATFPDLISVLDANTGAAVPSDAVAPGQEVCVLVTSRRNLLLGGGLSCPELLEPLEKILGREILAHLGEPCSRAPEGA
ncbi:MAG TPA: hypothetical protein DIC53_05875 [Synergistaceae bacterium]|nr:hypothetical protein [Synergistaceae bacterium]